jgi:hypothetical protein
LFLKNPSLLNNQNSFIQVVCDLQPYLYDPMFAQILTRDFQQNCKVVTYEEWKTYGHSGRYKLYYEQEPTKDFFKTINLLAILDKSTSELTKKKF